MRSFRVALAIVTTVGVTVGVVATAMSVGTPKRAPEEPRDAALAPQPVATAEPAHRAPAQCDDLVASAKLRATDLAWRADGGAVAVTSDRDGDARIAILTAPTWDVGPVVEGAGARWSASSRYFAFVQGSSVVVTDRSGTTTRARIAAASFGWQGDTLVYWDGNAVRAWRDGATGRFGEHVPDLSPIHGRPTVSFSADGTHYIVTSSDGSTLYGATIDGRAGLVPLPGATWSTAGANLLAPGAGSATLLTPAKRIYRTGSAPPVFGLWSPDGSQAMFGERATAATWNVIGWDGQKMGDTSRVPSGFRFAAFEPQGTALAAAFDNEVRIYRCGAATTTHGGLISRDRAKELVARTGDLKNVTLNDSKLVRWADIAQITKWAWAPRSSAPEPDAMVWVLMYAGEAKRPPELNVPSLVDMKVKDTVSLILYVLDAQSGEQIGIAAAAGTWWIGQPFESLIDRAPDPTAHPFEPAPGATPPIVMPTAPPTPTLAASRATSDLARVESAAGGWSLSFPDGWWPQRWGFAGATLTAHDPDLGVASAGVALNWSGPVTVRVEVWANPSGLDAIGYARQQFNAGAAAVTIAGKPGATFDVDRGPQPPDNRGLVERSWIVPTLSADRMLVVTATPAESAYRAKVEAVIASIELSAPRSTAARPDITRQQVLERWIGASAKYKAPRAEAKLVTYAQASANGGGNGMLRLDRDPDQLVWIVAVSLKGMPESLTAGRGLRDSGPATWQLYVTPAYTSDRGEGLWGQTSWQGDWPAFFDTLVDLS